MLKKIIFFIVLAILTYEVFASEPPTQSEYALIRRPVIENPLVWKMTKSVTNELWGKNLYYYPYSSSQDYAMGPDYYLYSGMCFTLDHSWHRILYSECLSNWIRAYGDFGTGVGKFNFPRSIDVELPSNEDYVSYYYYIFVADTENDRIVKLKYRWYPTYEMIYDGEITGSGLFRPLDLDINNDWDFWPVTNDYLWVLNGNSQIKRFTFDGQLKKTYGEFGSGEGQFNHPQAIACGRNAALQPPHDPFANTTHIHIADTGNNRVVWLIKSTGGESILWYKIWEAPAGSYIVDLDVDNFGHVWVVDSEDSRFFKLTYDLEPLCTFGSEGTGTNQFLTPVSFANTGGWLGCGNVFVAEYWGEESGGQYFAIGTDVLDIETYRPSEPPYFNTIWWNLIDPAYSTIKIYDESDVLKRTLFEDAFLFPSGTQTSNWDGTDDFEEFVPSGNYRFEITAVSVYEHRETGEPVNTVIRDGWLCNVHPDDKPGDADGDGWLSIADVLFIANYYFGKGPPSDPVWKMDTDGELNPDCRLTIADAVYLANHLFKGTPGPTINFSCTVYGWNCH